jgi:hypothetical protein
MTFNLKLLLTLYFSNTRSGSKLSIKKICHVSRQDREEWMNFNSFLNDKTVQSKDLIREKDKKKAAREEEDRIRYCFLFLCSVKFFFA